MLRRECQVDAGTEGTAGTNPVPALQMSYQAIEANLAKARGQLDAALASVPEADWARKPAAGGWSVGEVLAHLIQVECAVHDAGVKTLAKPPKPLKRGWMPAPIFLIKYRGIKRETPIPLDPALVTSKEEMLAKFAERRQQTLAFLREALANGRDLAGYHWRHPFFGSLTFHQWCRVLASHEIRHTKQIREIVSSFQS